MSRLPNPVADDLPIAKICEGDTHNRFESGHFVAGEFLEFSFAAIFSESSGVLTNEAAWSKNFVTRPDEIKNEG